MKVAGETSTEIAPARAGADSSGLKYAGQPTSYHPLSAAAVEEFVALRQDSGGTELARAEFKKKTASTPCCPADHPSVPRHVDYQTECGAICNAAPTGVELSYRACVKMMEICCDRLHTKVAQVPTEDAILRFELYDDNLCFLWVHISITGAMAAHGRFPSKQMMVYRSSRSD